MSVASAHDRIAAAARAMREVLIDRARRRRAAKRGGGQLDIDIDQLNIAVDAFAERLLDLDAAPAELARLSPRQARASLHGVLRQDARV